jgi:Holliday junction DNA helicase RuvA
MIVFLSGRLARVAEDHCVLDVGGVGYRVAMSTGSLAALPAEGDEVTVHTHMHVREDEMALFGFESDVEKGLFEKLITVSGVGPKVALAALSSFDADQLSQAIADEDVALVSSVPGIGTKTAQRVILDLKDKLVLTTDGAAPTSVSSDARGEVREALAGMGFSAAETSAAIKGYDGPPDDAQGLLKYALARLGGGS